MCAFFELDLLDLAVAPYHHKIHSASFADIVAAGDQVQQSCDQFIYATWQWLCEESTPSDRGYYIIRDSYSTARGA